MIPLFKVYMSEKVDKPLLETIHSGWVGQCGKVDEWEKVLAKKLKNPRILSLSAGTHGLHLALKLAGVERKDEVITTALTCFATTTPILAQGAEPVWADIQADSLNIDPQSVHQRITKYTKAIIAFEGGSKERDKVDWMVKYKKKPIYPVIYKNKIINKYYVYGTYKLFPSLTVMMNKFG